MLKSLPLLPLAPVLLVQGLAVRRRALRLPEAAGSRAGTQGRGARLGLLVLGDSAAAGVGAATQDDALVGQLRERFARRHRVDWRLLATSGHTAADALGALGAFEDFRIDMAVTSVGVNDVVARTPLRRFRHTVGELVDGLRRRGARGIVLSGVPPMGRFPVLPQPLRAVLGARATELDAVLAEVARERGAVHLPMHFTAGLGPEHMAPDGFHPGPAIYRAWADAAHDALTGPVDRAAAADRSAR
jgi:lysophospholipase L1-like esterase